METQSSQNSAVLPPIALDRLIENVPFQVYADSDGMNSSGLKDLLRSPAHYYEFRYNRIEEKETDALLFGKLFHYAVLEPRLFKEKHVVEPVFEGRTQKGELTTSLNCKEVKEKRAAWYGSLKEGAIVVPQDLVEKLTIMANRLLNHKVASKLLEKGVRETTMWWRDQVTGEVCKMRPDFVSEKWGLIDLKTAMDAREHKFWRDVDKHEYDLQAAHYLSGGKSAGVCRPDAFTFLVIEKDPPFEIAVYPAGMSILARGERKRERGMGIYARCKKTNVWPGYNHEAKTLEFPDWLMAQELYEDDDE